MRTLILIFACLFIFSPFLWAQTLPLMRSHQKNIYFKEGNKKQDWTISPEFKPDSWNVLCGNKKTKVTFYSDCDSLSFMMKKGKKIQFYILLNEKDSALTELVGVDKPQKQTFSYKISPVFEQKRLKALQVDFAFQGDKSGQTDLHYPDEHWGSKDLQRGLIMLESPQEGVRFLPDYQQNKIVVKHLPSQKIVVRYQITQIFNDSITERKGNLPLIQSSYFHLLDNTFFMYPMNADYNSIKHHFVLEWTNFPADWLIANSFGFSQKEQKVTTTLQTFQHSLWLGGDFRASNIKIKGNPVYVLLRGSWKQNKEKEFVEVLKKTVPQQRKFWKDYKDKYFIISILPTYAEWSESHKDFGIMGTGLTNSFACFVANNDGLAEKWSSVRDVFNHELMHNWIGGKIQNSNLETFDYWFSEGFTEYFCYKNMLNSGLMTETEWLDKTNEIYTKYQLSPLKNMPNDSLTRNNFWYNPQYEKLPYMRGMLFAFALDMRIKNISQNAYSLDNVMWELLDHCQTKSLPFDRKVFLSLLQKYAQEDMQAFFDAHIIRGEDFDFSKMPILSCLQIDVSENIAKWKIIGQNLKSCIVE